MNMTKLAKISGVSVSTISKVFSGSHEISEKTRNKIIQVAKENGCYEKYFKPRYEKKLVAVICPEILGIHYTKLATDIEKSLRINNATMLLSTSNFSVQNQNELIEYYTKYVHVDGIIVIEPCGRIRNSTDIPVVAIGIEKDESNVSCVNTDINFALDESLNYLRKNGYKKIGFIGETLADIECKFFLDAMKRNYFFVDKKLIVISDKRFYDAGYYAMDSMLKKGNLPSVIYAAYSHIAVGIMQRLKEDDISIPEDISLICMDDISSVPYSTVRLSCIKMHLDNLSAIAVDLIIKQINNNSISINQSIMVKREFFEGETIKKIE